MIRGRLAQGRPLVDSLIIVPRLNLFGRAILLIDTGADFSTIHPYDASGLGVDHRRDFRDSAGSNIAGVGGEAVEFRERARILLQHVDGSWDHIPILLGFAVPNAANLGLPSLLGRNVLRNYRLTFEEAASLVVLQTPAEVSMPSAR